MTTVPMFLPRTFINNIIMLVFIMSVALRRIFRLLVAILVMGVAPPSLSASEVSLRKVSLGQASPAQIVASSCFFQEDSGPVTPTLIWRVWQTQPHFVTCGSTRQVHVGYHAKPLWLMFDLEREPNDGSGEFVLQFAYSPMQHLEFYLVDENGEIINNYLTGKDFPYATRPLIHHQYAFPLSLEANHHYSVLMRLQTSGSMQLPISIVSRQRFDGVVSATYLGFGIYYGLIMLAIIMSMFVFFSLRDREFLSYATYVFAVAMSQASLHGLAYQMLWPNSVYWNTISSVFFMGITSSALAVFTLRFLNLRTLAPILSVCLQIYAVLCLGMAISSVYFYGATLIQASGYVLALMTILMLGAGAVAVRKRHPQGWYYLTAIVAYLVSVFFYSLKDIGVVANSIWTEYGIIFGSLVEVGVFSAGLASKIRRIDRAARDAEIQIQKSSAIANMTQMLAHDVRKPFSILKIGLGMLGGAKDPYSVNRVLARLVPEIDKAVASVDGLIADVMEVGSTSNKLIKESARPAALIEICLGEIFRVYPKSDVRITYDFRHAHLVSVHAQKVGRVFSNIVGNALQAMKYSGEIWFKTKESKGFVEFTVGNAGSIIPPENLPKLFEAFFTSGKKGGTGLGLAIAEKVVKAHGGEIWCESRTSTRYPDGFVEFKFTLPVAQDQLDQHRTELPAHSYEICSVTMEARSANGNNVGCRDNLEEKLEQNLITAGRVLGRALRVLIVDDEEFYRQGLCAALSGSSELNGAVFIRLAADCQQALEIVSKDKYDLIITDVDLGPTSTHGFALVQAIRNMGISSHICVHSNRVVAADYRTAISVGANAFLSKPVSRAQLLKLAIQAVPV